MSRRFLELLYPFVRQMYSALRARKITGIPNAAAPKIGADVKGFFL